MPNNCNQQSIVRQRFKDLPVLSHKLYMHMRALLLADIVIVARVQPRTSKGITDLIENKNVSKNVFKKKEKRESIWFFSLKLYRLLV